jgi:hypothetical protein
MTPRRFAPPWSVEEGETYFVVKDVIAVVMGEEPTSN